MIAEVYPIVVAALSGASTKAEMPMAMPMPKNQPSHSIACDFQYADLNLLSIFEHSSDVT